MGVQAVPTIDPIIGNKIIFAVRTPTRDSLRMGVSVRRAGLFTAEEPFSSPSTSYGALLIGRMTNGWLQIISGEEILKASAGQFGIIDCIRPHRFVGGQDSRLQWLEVAGVTVPGFVHRLAPQGAAVMPPDWSASLAEYFDKIIQNIVHGRGNESEINRDITTLLYGFTARQENRREHDAQIIHNAMNFICLHFSEDLNIDTMAAQFSMDKFRFIRSFEQVAGMTPYAYLIQTRIEQAQWILVNSTNKITDIGRRCGFKNDTTFGVAFKKEIGLTPGQWRSKHQFRSSRGLN